MQFTHMPLHVRFSGARRSLAVGAKGISQWHVFTDKSDVGSTKSMVRAKSLPVDYVHQSCLADASRTTPRITHPR